MITIIIHLHHGNNTISNNTNHLDLETWLIAISRSPRRNSPWVPCILLWQQDCKRSASDCGNMWISKDVFIEVFKWIEMPLNQIWKICKVGSENNKHPYEFQVDNLNGQPWKLEINGKLFRSARVANVVCLKSLPHLWRHGYESVCK